MKLYRTGYRTSFKQAISAAPCYARNTETVRIAPVKTPSIERDANTAQRLFELTTLYEVSRLLQLAGSEQLTFDVLTAVMGLTGARWGIIWTAGSDECTMQAAHACGLNLDSIPPSSLPVEWINELSARSRPLLLRDGRFGAVPALSRGRGIPLPSSISEYGPEMILPLTAGKKLTGLIALGPNFLNRKYDQFLQDLLGSVGYMVGLVLDRQPGTSVAATGHFSDSAKACRQRFPALAEIVGESQAVLDLYHNLLTVANASCTVLLEGETGTGKQLAAEVIHRVSPRSAGPFIEVDCGSVPESLIESELFGHSKGAFTGAYHDRKGVFELADRGTLFLDEVSNLPFSVQGRLLRILQERRFRPVGGSSNIEVDVRVIAATNLDLHKAVQEEKFREDLFYRLYVYPIRLPPLRERKEDIPVLASHFLKRCAEENNLPMPGLNESVLSRLSKHAFPGNIRELRHIMERVLLRANGTGIGDGAELNEFFSRQSANSTISGERVKSGIKPVTASPQPWFPPANPFARQVPRGAWVIKVLRKHRFNIRAASEALTSCASMNPLEDPPLTDRSSLTYYLQGECFRLYLQENGDIDRVGFLLCPEDDELRRIAALRAQKYVDLARSTLVTCNSQEEARKVLLQKFSKLPRGYRDILTRLTNYLWDMENL